VDPEALRTWPKGRYSGHPEAVVGAVGTLADALTAGHPYDDAYEARRKFYARRISPPRWAGSRRSG
jgi:hypothetical protein